MCCGRDEIPLSEIVMSEVVMPEAPAGKVALYTQVRGMAVQIGNFGQATNTSPCIVPEAVALELAPDKTLGPAPLAPLAAETEAPSVVVVDEEEESDDNPAPRRRRK